MSAETKKIPVQSVSDLRDGDIVRLQVKDSAPLNFHHGVVYPYIVEGPAYRRENEFWVAGHMVTGVDGSARELVEAWREVPAEPTELGTIVEVNGIEYVLGADYSGSFWAALGPQGVQHYNHGRLPDDWKLVQARG